MISCSDFLSEISNYLDGDVAHDIRVELERHLLHCNSCRVLVDSTTQTIHIVTDANSFELPEVICKAMAERIVSRIHKEPFSE